MKRIDCDLMVVGTGIAGIAASAFASARGYSVVQTGMATSLMFAAGCFDLLGVHPVEDGTVVEDPFAALAELRKDQPRHPYAKLDDDEIRSAFGEFLDFCGESGLEYHVREGRNMQFPTPLGTLKTTYCVPRTMIAGVRAVEEKLPCALIDMQGLKGHSAQQIASILGDKLNVVASGSIVFPEMEDNAEVYPVQMGMALENPRVRGIFAERIRAVMGDAKVVGVPAMLGQYLTKDVMDDLDRRLGVEFFEVPTMPPGIPGQRLKEAFVGALRLRGVNHMLQKRVLCVERTAEGFRFEVGADWPQFEVFAKGAVLASGRFLGKGLQADRTGVREAVFDLPVTQPEKRNDWHEKSFLDARGHAMNSMGVETDESFRPLGADGAVVSENLFAVGSILAHQDWMRQKCGSGLGISTAYKAVKALKI
ncbi:glycerol-3-phosphate dehydrogenase subunit GlpB [Salidesulfovibrio onnuriiensis]|uniref:glycerol-3-phosphate dehydrogenase subunit GlpB n=1 Tax=Salidesulfovibrio onnuriiensis TaxID=2583823 RepID=UPI00164FEA89|nr:glycerol-3-phosphate dehydrogenase subunit GlpB [Salidesulfovibrio onnuriiensis]